MMAKILKSRDVAMVRYNAGGAVYGATTKPMDYDRTKAIWAEVVTDTGRMKAPAIARDKSLVVEAVEKQTGAKVTDVWYDP